MLHCIRQAVNGTGRAIGVRPVAATMLPAVLQRTRWDINGHKLFHKENAYAVDSTGQGRFHRQSGPVRRRAGRSCRGRPVGAISLCPAAYALRAHDPDFARAWDAARIIASEVAIDELQNRAIHGWQEEVWHAGACVGTRQRHDNRLLLALVARNDRRNAGDAISDDRLAARRAATRFAALVAALRADAPVDACFAPTEGEARADAQEAANWGYPYAALEALVRDGNRLAGQAEARCRAIDAAHALHGIGDADCYDPDDLRDQAAEARAAAADAIAEADALDAQAASIDADRAALDMAHDRGPDAGPDAFDSDDWPDDDAVGDTVTDPASDPASDAAATGAPPAATGPICPGARQAGYPAMRQPVCQPVSTGIAAARSGPGAHWGRADASP